MQRAEFKDGAARAKNRVALNEAINAVTATRSTSEWVELLNEAGVPSGPIYSMDQVFADPQVQHLKMRVDVPHPLVGSVGLMGSGVSLSDTPPSIRSAAPALGADNDAVLASLKVKS